MLRPRPIQVPLHFIILLSFWSLQSSARRIPFVISSIPRGGSSSSDEYSAQLDACQSQALATVAPQLESLRTQIIDQGVTVENFGATADAICNQALEAFGNTAPPAPDATASAVYERQLAQLQAAIDAPLHVLYLKQLGYIRQAALQNYRANTKGDYEAMLNADAVFCRQAEAATRDSEGWDYSQERAFLQAVMSVTADAGRKATQVQLDAAQHQQTTMAFLQSQQNMIQQLQMQLYGQTSPWNVGVAYRIPDTNFNLQGSYQQGRANVQLSCVPDEYAPFLGPNGFTNGVGPGNLGLSLNLSL